MQSRDAGLGKIQTIAIRDIAYVVESAAMKDNPLVNVHLFADLEMAELDALVSRALTKTFPKNCILIHEGEHTYSLYVILSGKVKVFASDEDGKEVVLTMLGPGECVGEMALLEDAPRSASVITTERCKLMIISREDFVQCLHRHPPIALNLLRSMSRRLRQQNRSTKNLALLGVYERVANVLREQAVEQDGMLVIEGLTQQGLASMVGASREMVSLVLKALRTEGYIAVEQRRITIEKDLPIKW